MLVSQGIEATVEQEPETGHWQLTLAPADLARAQEAIRLYLEENRGRRWRQEVRFTGLIFDWRGLLWGLAMALCFFIQETAPWDMVTGGRMDAAAVRSGQWWRLITATTLHQDIGHLAANLGPGLVLVGLVMGLYGPGRGALAVVLAGALGNLLGLALHAASYLSVGASGMVMGALGLLSVQSLRWRGGPGFRALLWRGFLGGVLLFILVGLNPGTDVLAHLGGFAAGSLLGLALNLIPSGDRAILSETLAAWASVLIPLAAWLLAWPAFAP